MTHYPTPVLAELGHSSAESYDDMDAWLKLVLRGAKRAVKPEEQVAALAATGRVRMGTT